MSSREYAANPADLPRGTLVELLLDAADRFGDAVAFRQVEERGSRELTYRDVRDGAFTVAAALDGLGLERGDRAAILSENRPEWALTDYGCLCAGVQDVPVYSTLTPPQIQYLLSNSGARILFAADAEQMEKVLDIRGECPDLERIVVFDAVSDAPDDVLSWEAFLEAGRERREERGDDDIEAGARRADPDDVATMLYTSGTTGDPKGVMLTHQNIHSNVRASERVLRIDEADNTLSILPLSHIFQRMVDYLFFHRGCTIAYPRSRDTIPEDMRREAPTVMVAVPRVYEKVYNRVMEASGLKAALVEWAREVGDAWADETLAGRRPSLVLRTLYRLADALVFSKIRDGVGGRIRYFVSGGGPLSRDINKFFYSVGLTILEGYGLTETSPVTNVNTEEDFRIGTVGKPLPGTEVRIAEDGEILVRGPQVMKGYFRAPEATEEAITSDGWFKTGDVGEIDEDGFLTVTDRKKDLIITSGGKNIAPQPIENVLKKNRYVEQVVMVGDGRKFAAILVVPAFGNLERWAKEKGIAHEGVHDLLVRDEVLDFLESEIYGELDELARYELPKKVGLIAEEFTVEGGALTPTQKVKRRVVEDRYRELIDSFYLEENFEKTMFVADEQ